LGRLSETQVIIWELDSGFRMGRGYVMNNLLLSLITASVAGTIIFVILLTLKPVTEKLFAKSWNYYMSFIPVFFLLWGVELVGRLYGLIGLRFSTPALPSGVNMNPMTPVDFSSIYPTMQQTLEILPIVNQPLSYSEQAEIGLFHSISKLLSSMPIAELMVILVIAWALGAILYTALNVRSYWTYRCTLLRHSIPCVSVNSPIKAVVSKTAATAMMIGFIKPLIILPDVDFTDEELEMVVAHELIHFRRKDVWLKLVVFMAKAIHWFNPVVYFLCRHIDTLCELSCDEKVVIQMNSQERKLYGETILLVLHHGTVQRNLVCASGLCDSKKNVKRRLLNMLKAKKARKSIVALSVIISLLIAGVSGFVAYRVHGAPPLSESPTTENQGVSGVMPPSESRESRESDEGSIIISVPDGEGNFVPVTQTFTFHRNIEFVSSLPSRLRDDRYWNAYEIEGEDWGFQVYETIADYDITLMFLRTIMTPSLADQLWESPYFDTDQWIPRELWGFWAFFTSDQFIQLLEFTGEDFVIDFLNRDASENLALFLGDNLEEFMNEVAALDAIAEIWSYDQQVLAAIEEDLEARGMQGTPEWEDLVARGEDITRRTEALNFRSFALQNFFDQIALEFISRIVE